MDADARLVGHGLVSVALRGSQGLVPGRFRPWWLTVGAGYSQRLTWGVTAPRSSEGPTSMIEIARHRRVLAGGMAVGVAGVLGFAGATASAEPVVPQPALPAPATVTQTVTVAPNAAPLAPQSLGQPVVGVPAGIATSAVPAPPPATITPAGSGSLTDFFKEKGVNLEPQNARDFKALTIVLPIPKGWAQIPDPNVPDAFAVIADRVGGNGLYSSNAQVIVYKLVGDFDPKEAISHGFIDSL